MRYLLELKIIIFVKEYRKKFMDTAAKTGKNAAKTASKWVLQKAREASGDLIGNIIIEKITLPSKTKNKEKEKKMKKVK